MVKARNFIIVFLFLIGNVAYAQQIANKWNESETSGVFEDDKGLFDQAITMLHQQQAEIEALKALINQRNEPLGAEFEKVLKDNLWQLYEDSNKWTQMNQYAIKTLEVAGRFAVNWVKIAKTPIQQRQ